MSSNPSNHQQGATLIEIAIAIPIVLAVIFFTISISLALNARFSLHSSMINGVKLGLSRSDASRLGMQFVTNYTSKGMNPFVDSWYYGSSPSFSTIPEDFFCKGVSYDECKDNMTSLVFAKFDQQSLTPPSPDLPPSYFYTLFYIYQSMEQSIGSSLRYPCSTDQSWCMFCQFQDPGFNADLNGNYEGTYPLTSESIHLTCSIRPWGTILGSVFALLGGPADSGGSVITRRVHATR